MSEARHSPPRGFLSPGNGGTEGGVKTIEAGREVDYHHEKRNLETGDSTDSVSSHRSSYYAWCDKLRVAKTHPNLPSRGKEL